MAPAPKLQPAPPKPPRSNARFWLWGGAVGTALLIGSLVAGVYTYQRSQSENIARLNSGLLGLGGPPPSENALRRPLVTLPTELPPGEPAAQVFEPPGCSPPSPPPEPPPAPPEAAGGLPPPVTVAEVETRTGRQAGQGEPAPRMAERPPLLYRGAKRPEHARPDRGGGADAATSAARRALGPRSSREAFAAHAGAGSNLYHRAEVVAPPAGLCVSPPHQVWDLQFQGEVHTQLPGRFTVLVVSDLDGRVYDGAASAPCAFPLVPAGSRLECLANTVDVARGDRFVQAVCDRVDFPGGGAMPLDGFPLVGPSGSAGVPADSRYPWGDILADAAVDIIGAIPGALLTVASVALTGPVGVAVNIGSDRFEETAGQYRRTEFRRVPVLHVPSGAPAGLRQNGSLALPDERR